MAKKQPPEKQPKVKLKAKKQAEVVKPEKGKVGRKAHVPTPAQREKVKTMSAVGIPQTAIATVLGINKTTLLEYYRTELDTAATIANASIGGALYKKAMSGDTAALIFWAKTRLHFRETVQLTGEDGGPIEHTIVNGELTGEALVAELEKRGLPTQFLEE